MDQIIDREGLVVAPGSIDTDTCTEHAASQVLDGVTTALALLVNSLPNEASTPAR
jgi:hypothetical protein